MRIKTIKLNLLPIMAVLVVSCGGAEKEEKMVPNTYTLTGEVSGLEETPMIIMVQDSTQKYGFRRDSIFPDKNGKFSYTGSVENLEKKYLISSKKSLMKRTGENGFIPSAANQLYFYAYPGAEISVKGRVTKYMDAYPSGDSLNNALAELNRKIYPLINDGVDLRVAGFQNKEQQDSLEKRAQVLFERANELKVAFILRHPNSPVALEALIELVSRGDLGDEKAIELFENMDDNLETFPGYGLLGDRIEAIRKTAVGNPFPALATQSTLDGQSFDSSELRGKYVLLDFWGTWCGPCVEEMPQVAAFAKKYQENLVVIGINSGEDKKRIQTFLDKNKEYTWRQLINVPGDSEDNFINRFNVVGFPTKYILDPNGVILKKYLGSGEEAFEYLESELQ